MRKLGIYCGGSLGEDILSFAELDFKERWDEILFIDDVIQEKTLARKNVMSFDEFLQKGFAEKEIELIIANGEPFYRKKICIKLEKAGLKLGKLISNSAIIPDNVTICEGGIVHWQAIVSTGTTVGKNAFVGKDAMVGHHVKIGEHSVVSACSYIGGWSRIGNATYIGAGSTIRDRIKIGNNCIIGMGSVVLKDVEDNTVVAGNPAKVLRKNEKLLVFKENDEENNN